MIQSMMWKELTKQGRHWRYDMRAHVKTIPISIAAGVLLGILFTASPLSLFAMAAAVAVVTFAGRGLPDEERRLLIMILGAAFAARLAIVLALVVIGLPHLNDLAVGSLSGDDAYYLGRAIRTRDILFNFGNGKYDYFVVLDEYGRTSYVTLLSAIQILLGPTPFGMRVLNAVFFLAGAALLFRAARPAFGPTAAFSALVVLLFLPSLLWSSISLLKESLYFFSCALLLYCATRALHAPRPAKLAVFVVLGGVGAWLLTDLRRDALTLLGSGLAAAVVIRFVAATRQRLLTVSAMAMVAATLLLMQPSVRSRAALSIESMARVQGGHVFTVGHSYKLLDPAFYAEPAAPGGWQLNLTPEQAGRFVLRAAASFIVTPWPWEMTSRGELALLPEQLLWYLLLIGLPAGVVAGWRLDATTTALFVGYAAPTALALALTNGNVGTLMRLRGLVTPYLLWVSMLGLLTLAHRVLSRRHQTPAMSLAPGGARP